MVLADPQRGVSLNLQAQGNSLESSFLYAVPSTVAEVSIVYGDKVVLKAVPVKWAQPSSPPSDAGVGTVGPSEATPADSVQKYSPLKILSAKRGESYEEPNEHPEIPFTNRPRLTPNNPKTHLIVVVRLGGISGDEFATISKTKKPYLTAGERRYDFSVMVYGGEKKTYDAKGNLISEWKNSEIKLAAAVPRQTLNFTLFIGDYPPLDFNVEEQVHDELH